LSIRFSIFERSEFSVSLFFIDDNSFFMKKISFVLVLLLSALSVFAQYQNQDSIPVKIDGIWYALNVRTMTADLTRAIKKDIPEDVVIPAELVWQHNNYRVKSVGPSSFMGCKVKTIVVPESVEKIGDGAFSFCKQLTSVTILGSPVLGQTIFFASKSVKELNLAQHFRLMGISDDITVNYLDEQQLASDQQTNQNREQNTIEPQPRKNTESDVDKNIPFGKQGNDHTFAVIIANENYRNVANVEFAANDGLVFSRYCERTLGLPKSNIHLVQDATLNDIRIQIGWLNDIVEAYNGDVKIIFYYAGHGIPDEKNKSAYLLPSDGIGNNTATGYALADLYKSLSSVATQKQPQVTVLLDACFSGSTRSDNMLTSARGIAIKVKEGVPLGNMIVLTAATGDETAYPNKAEQHGMFTYFLLKKIQETKGQVKMSDLSEYVITNVRQQSVVQNGKSQTPTLIASPNAQNWQGWSFQ